jgi:hypothetical protein
MAATSLGTVGVFGIASDESGFVIHDLSWSFSAEQKEFLNRSGEIIGLARFKEKVDVKMSGFIPSSAPFSGKISAVLTITNAMPAHKQQAAGGSTIITEITRSLNNEDFEKIEISATHYPFLTVA